MNPHDLTPARRTLITVAVIVASILAAMASTIANVVLPQIRASTGASQDQVLWVLTSFILAGVIATPTIGWLEARFGRRTLLLATLVGYGVASVLCGLTSNIYAIVLFRVLQGGFGAFFIPMSQAVLLDINPPEKHGEAMSMWGMGAVLGPLAAPVLGGWLGDHLSWRWVFLVNAPLVVLAIFLISIALPKETPSGRQKLDVFGYCALAISLAGLQLMLDRGPSEEWFASPEIWIELALAVFGLWIFGVHMATAKHTLFDRRLFGDFNFVLASGMIVFLGIFVFAGAAVLPTLMQNLLGYPVMHTGLVQLPRGVGSFIAMFLVGRMVGRINNRIIVLTGLALTSSSYFLMSSFSLGMDEHLILIAGLLQGLGVSMIFVPLSALAFVTIAPQLRTQGAALFTLMRNIGSSVGISMVGVLQIYNSKIVQSRLLEDATPDNANVIASGIDMQSLQSLAAFAREISRQANMVAYIDSFHLLAWMCVAIAPLVLLIRSAKKAPAHA